MAKPGPKREYVTDPETKEPVVGLRKKGKANAYRLDDGREFRAPTVSAAIAKFHRMRPPAAVVRLSGPLPLPAPPAEMPGEPDPRPSGYAAVIWEAAAQVAQENAARYAALPKRLPRSAPLAERQALHAALSEELRAKAVAVVPSVEGNYWQFDAVFDIAEEAYIAQVREDLLHRPQWLAKMTGVEWVGWHEHQRPVKGESLEDLGELYYQRNPLSPNELSRSRCFWGEFVEVAGGMNILTVDQVNHDLAARYETFVEGQRLSPKSRLHRYRKVRGILHFAIKRGKSVEHCRRALDVLAMLEVKDAHPLDPTPITPAAFWAIYGAAVQAGDRTYAALLLTALNGALYPGEVASVRWEEIDFATGGYVSRRSKTGVSRVAVLWPETLAAVKALPRDRDQCFVTRIRSYTVHSVADRFGQYRDAARKALPDTVGEELTFSWIRDAAYSTALAATDFAKAELLAGHRLAGTSDNYLRRNPQLVQAACEAIGKAFDVAGNVARIEKEHAGQRQ